MTDEYGKIHTDGSRSGGQPLGDSIEAKALALLNEVREERSYPLQATIYRVADADIEALCRAIEQHEAFKQEVSDIVEAYVHATNMDDWEKLKALIIPKPKPDPLVEVIAQIGWGNGWDDETDYARQLRAALEARGLEIREI